jgi:hypothetical protein
MSLALLPVGAVNKLSLISESVAEIQINIPPCTREPDQHNIRVHADIPRITTFCNDIIRTIRVPPLLGTHLSCDTSHWLSVGGLYTILVNISRGMVEYHPTTIIIVVHRFTGSHKASLQSVQIKYLLKVPLRMVLNRRRLRLPPWSLKYPHLSLQPSHLKILHFPLVALLGLKLNHQYKPLTKSILNPLV